METERVDGPAPAPTTARIVLLVVGAAGLIIGSFLAWLSFGALADQAEALGAEIPDTAGVNLDFSVFYTKLETDPTGADIFASAGLVTIALGVLALAGILIPWLARAAGALGIVAFVLWVVAIYRTEGGPAGDFGLQNIGLGMWLVLLGSILSLIGGFLVARRTVVTTTTARTDVPPEP